MTTTSPNAKFTRTLILALAGNAATWASIDWLTDYRTGAKIVTLHVIGALLASGVAYLQAFKEMAAATPLGKAFAQFSQQFGATLTTIVVTELTSAALQSVGRAILQGAIAALLGGFAALALNASEQEDELDT